MFIEPNTMIFAIISSLLFISGVTCTSQIKNDELFDFQCRPPDPKIKFRSDVRAEKKIFIELSNNLLSQVISRAFAIILREVYGYKKIYLYEFDFKMSEQEKMHHTYEAYKLDLSREYLKRFDSDKLDKHLEYPYKNNWSSIHVYLHFLFSETEARLNLGIWTPPGSNNAPPEIKQIGELWMGRFGFFIPKQFLKSDMPMLSYTFLQDIHNAIFDQFVFNAKLLSDIQSLADNNCANSYIATDGCFYVPDHCQNKKCITILSSNYNETSFIISHIMELKLYINVLWLDHRLLYVTRYLLDKRQKYIILHWKPSELIDNDVFNYEMLAMPQCERMASSPVPCVYELTPILKYVSPKLWTTMEPVVWSLNKGVDYSDLMYIFSAYNRMTMAFTLDLMFGDGHLNARAIHSANDRYFVNESTRINLFNQVACDWYKWPGSSLFNVSDSNKDKIRISIGGMFPQSLAYAGLEVAVNMAVEAITASKMLDNIKFTVLINNGECKSDAVMKNFVHFYTKSDSVMGVLGPACSETVEPIAGVSKHFRMPVVSYSAEGASFTDRDQYPYFFRTIGENRQYEHVYVRLMKKMGWKRVAALTEDGQKYTEYISHMESMLKKDDIELIANKKFPREATSDSIRQQLSDLKTEKVKIIIADVYDEQARIVMCEAFKLDMTASHGYVWFLPAWLSKLWNDPNNAPRLNVSCTENEMLTVINGHFSLSHVPYASDDFILTRENRTVAEWKRKLYKKANEQTSTINAEQSHLLSNYSGYAYDAVWVYALALEQLIKRNAKYLMDLHSIESTYQLIEIISNIDFNGASGRIQFGEGGTRFTNISIMQWINGTANLIGVFVPNVTQSNVMQERKIIGGQLHWIESTIVWFYPDGIPSDGTVICSVHRLAKVLSVDCTTAIYILITFVCLLLIIMVSMASFMFWKREYDIKLKQSAKVMRNFGIDLLSPSSMPINTLDKWEVPKDRVVINRRLGEGAFGTVYGGEAHIDDNGWTAVAVKTLKKGSSTEYRLDFLSEAEAMKRFDHTNVVKLLGVCLQTEPLYTIMEFMLYGDLKTFLLARRHLVGQKVSDDSDVSAKRLTVMALDVARALSYLADMKYVHRDVACRNCLVNAQRVVKLGDFGMARPMFESDYYKFNRKGMLPVRWMAPESLILGLFSPSSDVWSFGVLLYEIITFGSFPYQGLTNSQVLDHLKNGNTLVIPSGVKPQLEGLMNACWNRCYKKRPTASEVTEFISNYPRLITPCLDVPLASVQMPETDSDELELLPGLRKRNSQLLTEDVDGISKSTTFDGFDRTHTIPNGIRLNEYNPPYENEDLSHTFRMVVSNAYNPVEPLLQPNTEISSSSLSLRRYVPMCGFKRSSRSLAIEATSAI